MMGIILGKDTWQGETTRIYVAYPDRAAAEQWEHDPGIQEELQALRVSGHRLTVGWGYPHHPTSDYVITIARLVD